MNKIITAITTVFFLGFSSAITHFDAVKVYKIVKVHDLNDIRQTLEEARSKGLKISIAGARYAQGGQQSYPDGIVLDMMDFNKIISLDKKDKIIRVQSGVTWKQIQDYIQPYDYAIRVMQTTNVFSVGGSLGSNIHGKDPQEGCIIETVKSFHLMLADGKVINVSRQENPELFGLAIGGYGLFGIIIDVDLLLTGNEVYKMKTQLIDYRKYPQFFQSEILNNAQIAWLEAYFLKSKQGNLNTLKVTTYTRMAQGDKILAGLGGDERKDCVSRVDLMDKILKSHGHGQVILQEYFIPINKFVFFIDGLKKNFESFWEFSKLERGINARINVIRYIKQDKQSFLSYAKADSFAVEVVINTGQSLPAATIGFLQHWARHNIDLALSCKGTFYLTKTALYPDKAQLVKAYPEFNEFVREKKKYDPQEILMNQFYERYR